MGSRRASRKAMALLRRFKRRIALLVGTCRSWWRLGGRRRSRCHERGAEAAAEQAVGFLSVTRESRPRSSARARRRRQGYVVIGHGQARCARAQLLERYRPHCVLRRREVPASAEGIEPSSFFVRLTRELVRLLQEHTGEGYVFRTDLRLRPDPGATQVALSTDAALSYYESFGQNWERAALVKARAVAGDREAGDEFLAQLSPFIWRKYLDYAAIADIHAMKRRVHDIRAMARSRSPGTTSSSAVAASAISNSLRRRSS